MGILKKTKKADEKVTSAKKEVKKSVKKVEKTNNAVKSVSKVALNTILGPIVSEKGAALADDNVMLFKVARDANRVQIKNAVKELYGVIPEKVNVINVRGKAVTFGRRRGKRSDYKKALVKLPKGTSINIFEGV